MTLPRIRLRPYPDPREANMLIASRALVDEYRIARNRLVFALGIRS